MKINFKGTNNVYEQIVDEIIKYINLGIYKENEKLPSCRSLALELGVNPNTVEKAYTILANRGYIDMIPKKGAYVKVKNNDINKRDLVINDITRIKNSGVLEDELIEAVKEVYSCDWNKKC